MSWSILSAASLPVKGFIHEVINIPLVRPRTFPRELSTAGELSFPKDSVCEARGLPSGTSRTGAKWKARVIAEITSRCGTERGPRFFPALLDNLVAEYDLKPVEFLKRVGYEV